jgi:hypothetical protein
MSASLGGGDMQHDFREYTNRSLEICVMLDVAYGRGIERAPIA